MSLWAVWVTLLVIVPVSAYICARLVLNAVARHNNRLGKDEHNAER